MTTWYVIGYGSLMDEIDLRRTAPGAELVSACRVTGWRRDMDLLGRSRHCGVMNVQPQPDAWCNGVLIKVPESQMSAIRDRERIYDAHWVEPVDFHDDRPLPRAVIFSSTAQTTVVDWSNPWQRTYLDICLKGAMLWGRAFVEAFCASTYVNGRTLTEVFVREFAEGYPGMPVF